MISYAIAIAFAVIVIVIVLLLLKQNIILSNSTLAADECNLRTWKTSQVPIYDEMQERSYVFPFILFFCENDMPHFKRSLQNMFRSCNDHLQLKVKLIEVTFEFII